MKKKKVEYMKIILAIVASFFIAQYSSHEIFLPNTARIRPNLGRYLAQKLVNLSRDGSLAFNRITDFFNPNSPEAKLRTLPLQAFSKGVYAKANDSVSYTLIKVNEVEWVVYSLKVKGKTVKIKVPKNQELPSKGMLE